MSINSSCLNALFDGKMIYHFGCNDGKMAVHRVTSGSPNAGNTGTEFD
ncbi:MAG: hypothetical protein M3530_11405 [Thermoproteota archaeon]|nr:hypothetical protein [Thermoproteota archaeon]